jgi:hypothetical protein
MVDEVKLEQQQQRAKTPRAPRSHKTPGRVVNEAAPAQSELPPDAVSGDGAEAPKKRRRRRRPSGRGAGDAPAQEPQV